MQGAVFLWALRTHRSVDLVAIVAMSTYIFLVPFNMCCSVLYQTQHLHVLLPSTHKASWLELPAYLLRSTFWPHATQWQQ
jgi:hypothetical protein